MESTPEQRSRKITLTVREAGADAKPGSIGTLTGYIAVFNSDSHDLGGFVERIKPGAFGGSLAKNDVVCLLNHDCGRVLGRLSAGTLRLTEDATGLKFEVDLPDTQDGRDLKTLSLRGDLLGCSFGFQILGSEWASRDGTELVTLTEIDLHEVSVGVTFPAYPASSMEMRSALPDALKSRRDSARKRDLARLSLLVTLQN